MKSNSASVVKDYGILALMYHRFDENKYPSTNIKLDDFKSHINLMKILNLSSSRMDNLKIQ